MTIASRSDIFAIDFTGKISTLDKCTQFDEELVAEIRDKAKNEVDTFIVIDTGHAGQFDKPVLVSDHLNLSGSNPLVGPNNPIGERFPVVNDIYLDSEQLKANLSTETISSDFKEQRIAAGIKPGVVPTDKEIALFNKLGADFYCYNLIPTALIIAHAKKKIIGLIMPPEMKPIESLEQLLGGTF